MSFSPSLQYISMILKYTTHHSGVNYTKLNLITACTGLLTRAYILSANIFCLTLTWSPWTTQLLDWTIDFKLSKTYPLSRKPMFDSFHTAFHMVQKSIEICPEKIIAGIRNSMNQSLVIPMSCLANKRSTRQKGVPRQKKTH